VSVRSETAPIACSASPRKPKETTLARSSAVLDLDLDSARPRVERVLDQLLDRRGRTLDDLPGGDPVRYFGRQHSDPSRIVGGLFGDQRRKELHLISSRKVFDAFGFEAGEDLTGPVRNLGR
jgi:hypothetical protein